MAEAGSLWLDRPAGPDLDGDRLPDQVADVAIVGGGIVGSAAALLLAATGRSTILVDAGVVGAGTTGHSTGKATWLPGAALTKLVERVGADGARRIVEDDRAALDLLENWSNDLDDAGAAQRVVHLAYATEPRGEALLERELAVATRLELPIAWTDQPTPGTRAIVAPGQLLIEPALLCRALARAAQRRGVRVLEHARVTHVDGDDPVQLTLADGRTLAARDVLVATQVPIVDRSLVFAACSYVRSHVLAFEAPPGSPFDAAMYTGVDAGGLSIRPARAGDGSARIVVAGHGHPLDHREDGSHLDELEAHARELLSPHLQLGARTNGWLAHDASAADGRPFVGRSRGSKHVWIATGFGGWGLARGVAAARRIVDRITQDADDGDDPLDATRLAAFAQPAVATTSIRSAAAFLGDRLQLHGPEVAALQPGQGAVVRRGLRSIAVARDRDGALHAVEAACTHLGCLVRHDDERGKWQCPCHGSRFALDGSVRAGPATSPLERCDPQALQDPD